MPRYSILLTYGGALVISTDIAKQAPRLLLGLVLTAVNLAVIVFVFALSLRTYMLEKQEMGMARRLLSTQEQQILDAFVGRSDSDGIQLQSNDALSRSEDSLAQVVIDSSSVKVHRRVGVGAFGEVYQGSCFGSACAIKVLRKVTSESARVFRAEILLTSTLRHPNIVGFVGACWDCDLTCLLLEWVPKGSLEVFLNANEGLTWDAVLLKLVQDVARGMIYLHNREYIDEDDGERKRCVIHR